MKEKTGLRVKSDEEIIEMIKGHINAMLDMFIAFILLAITVYVFYIK